MSENDIILQFHGADWCPDCRRSKQFLEKHNIKYIFHNTDEIGRPKLGNQRIPTIIFPDGSFLQEPSDIELGRKLGLND